MVNRMFIREIHWPVKDSRRFVSNLGEITLSHMRSSLYKSLWTIKCPEMKNCLEGIGHFCMKNIFRISTQTLTYGNRTEDGRVPSRFVETRYFQSEEQLASYARRSAKEIYGAVRYHPSQTISARISSTAKMFAWDSEQHGWLIDKMRISVCELSPMKILSPVRSMEKTHSSAKHERRAWSAGQWGERKHYAGEK